MNHCPCNCPDPYLPITLEPSTGPLYREQLEDLRHSIDLLDREGAIAAAHRLIATIDDLLQRIREIAQ